MSTGRVFVSAICITDAEGMPLPTGEKYAAAGAVLLLLLLLMLLLLLLYW